jgi:hypothetical protein
MKDKKFTGWVYNCPAPGKRTYFLDGKSAKSNVVKRQPADPLTDKPRQMTIPMTEKQKSFFGLKVTK